MLTDRARFRGPRNHRADLLLRYHFRWNEKVVCVDVRDAENEVRSAGFEAHDLVPPGKDVHERLPGNAIAGREERPPVAENDPEELCRFSHHDHKIGPHPGWSREAAHAF